MKIEPTLRLTFNEKYIKVVHFFTFQVGKDITNDKWRYWSYCIPKDETSNINVITDTLYYEIIINLPGGIWSLVMYTLLDLMNDSYTYPLFCAAHICKTSNVMKEIRFGAIERN